MIKEEKANLLYSKVMPETQATLMEPGNVFAFLLFDHLTYR